MKILICADSAAMHTGFAKVIREIFIPLSKIEGYEIRQIGWFHHDPIEEVPWKIYHTKRIASGDGFKFLKDDKHGEQTTSKVIEDFKPNIVWTCGDPWHLPHMVGLKNNYSFKWVAQTYIDGSVLHDFEYVWNKADAIVPVTQFGYKILKENESLDQDLLYPPIYCGVNTETYHKLDDNAINKLRENIIETSIEKFNNPMIIGYVGRNQRRKVIPGFHILKSMFAHNKIYRCSKCGLLNAPNINYEFYYNGKERFYLYRCKGCNSNKIEPELMEFIFWLHCPPGDRGWNMPQLEKTWDVKDKILKTSGHQVLKGIPEKDFAKVFNTFDIYLSFATEGFGLPLLEAMACGTPVISPEFAAAQEFMKRTDLCWEVKECQIEDGSCIPRPLPNYDSIVNILDKLRNPEYYNKAVNTALETARLYTWDEPVRQWDKFLKKINKEDSTNVQLY